MCTGEVAVHRFALNSQLVKMKILLLENLMNFSLFRIAVLYIFGMHVNKRVVWLQVITAHVLQLYTRQHKRASFFLISGLNVTLALIHGCDVLQYAANYIRSKMEKQRIGVEWFAGTLSCDHFSLACCRQGGAESRYSLCWCCDWFMHVVCIASVTNENHVSRPWSADKSCLQFTGGYIFFIGRQQSGWDVYYKAVIPNSCAINVIIGCDTGHYSVLFICAN